VAWQRRGSGVAAAWRGGGVARRGAPWQRRGVAWSVVLTDIFMFCFMTCDILVGICE